MMRIAPDLGEIEDMFNRYTVFRVSLVLVVLFLFAGLIRPQALIAAVIFGFLGFVGLLDLMQTHHSLRRNYPIPCAPPSCATPRIFGSRWAARNAPDLIRLQCSTSRP